MCESYALLFRGSKHCRFNHLPAEGNPTIRFACPQCPKVFTRSDILRRHEAAHAAAAQSHDGNLATKRACFECAKARERCSKGKPCQRCSVRELCCKYPKSRSDLGNSQSPLPFKQVAISPSNSFAQSSTIEGQTPECSAAIAASDECPAYSIGPRKLQIENHRDASLHLLEPSGVANVVHMVDIAPQIPIDFSINWLPMDDSISIDYDSILGMDINSLGLFPGPTPVNDPQDPKLMNHTGAYPVPHIPATSHNSPHEMNHILRTNHLNPPWETTLSQMSSRSMSCTSSRSSTNTVSSVVTSVGLYATSTNGARLPCTKWSKKSKHAMPGAAPMKLVTDPDYHVHSQNGRIRLPRTDHILVGSVQTLKSHPRLTVEMFEQLCKRYRQLCSDVDDHFSVFAIDHFLSHAALNLCTQLYFDNFDKIVPILHVQVADLNEHWLLALGVCAIGCQYMDSEEFSACVVPLHEMLRRGIIAETETKNAPRLGFDNIALAQARILNHFGMVYFGSPDLVKGARAQHGVLVELALSSDFLSPSASLPTSQGIESTESQNLAWRSALMAECKRRCGYAIWLIDCMSIYHFSQRPLMPLAITQCPLPEDALWATKSTEDWRGFLRRTSGDSGAYSQLRSDVPSLCTAVVQIFTKKHVSADLDQFSRVLLLHGVYREIFQLKDCFARPLSSCVPAVQPANTPTNGSDTDSSLLSSWRNASLDCVDVLHWAANGTIAQNYGVEHPTVLHLHLARTVLLAPFEEIQMLAASIAAAGREEPTEKHTIASIEKAIDAERKILHWAQRDQYKARLAVLHCGCLFWHIRRYSCQAFYEPISVYLATLTLWAYCSYTSRTAITNHRDGSMSDDESTENTFLASNAQPIPTFIHLDRPNDDEMVQSFVLSGIPSNMRANITGVGDMYAAKGPMKILKEGRRILASVSMAWGRTKEFVDILESLERATSRKISLDASTTST
ncbi:hypothetical protein LEMA_P060210.1 [Plenodomus lingam JN3]|uniref:C2H2-type domain-containing protein n=2 Tax=Leptosphaeria maculans TaxID=5022 RepID=E4ZIG6_LEPMJ|nr:hypothetical protein LEMA_P060210.1 [Plenodomus lingam JN3]CBX90987.1 hypothetical protein LEMA_P060210.1 [Plenodomus lingam JN3]